MTKYCFCGDSEDDHKLRFTGPVECLIDECDCIQFEPDEDEVEEDRND